MSHLFLIAKASFAQERIFLDEQIRFASKDNSNIYLIPHLYRITSTASCVSISRLCHAVEDVIARHSVLRTALYLDKNSTIVQHCFDATILDNDLRTHGFSVINLRENDDDRHMNETISGIIKRDDLFDLSKGRVIRCYLFRHYRSHNDTLVQNDDLLFENDLILFCFHHSAFDGVSTSVFLCNLCRAYEMNSCSPMPHSTLQYIDYAVHERLMDMTSSQQFWHSELEGYNLQRPLPLPIDRHRSSTDQRSGLASVAEIDFDKDVSTAFLNYASTHHVTPFQLGLSIFYAFLFKLTHGQRDFCIASINANRYRPELQNLIGMFVATLPYRVQLNPQWSFDQLVEYVREKCLSILEHSHYPLQQILADFQLNQSAVPFLETVFDFITVSSEVNRFLLNNVCLEQMSIKRPYEETKFDFTLIFIRSSTPDSDGLSCSLSSSRDQFDDTTVITLARRLKHFCREIFPANSNIDRLNTCQTPISQLNLILPDEAKEMDDVMFCRQLDVVDEGMYI